MAARIAGGAGAAHTAAAEARIVAAVGRIVPVVAAPAAAATQSAASAAEEAWEGPLPRPPRLVSPFRRRTGILFARAEHRARIEGISS